MVFERIPSASAAEVDAVVESGDVAGTVRALLGLALGCENWRVKQDRALQLLGSDHVEIQRAAVLSLSHIARIDRRLDRPRVEERLQRVAREAPLLVGNIQVVLDDFDIYLSEPGQLLDGTPAKVGAEIARFLELARRHQGDVDFEGPRGWLIEDAEHALGVRFSPSYADFLRTLGCGDFAGIEIYGLISPDTFELGLPDVVWATKDARASTGLPEGYVLLGIDADEGHLLLPGAGPSGEVPVLRWQVGQPISGVVSIADSFGGWLLERALEVWPDRSAGRYMD